MIRIYTPEVAAMEALVEELYTLLVDASHEAPPASKFTQAVPSKNTCFPTEPE